MPDFKSNEYEFQGLVVGWLNEFLATGSYPFDTATQNPSLKTGVTETKFPDVQLWIKYDAKLAYCGWELKTPKTQADDTELLKNATEKAHATGAEYFVTWNMRDAIIWKTPKPGEKVLAEHRVKPYPSLYEINDAEDLKNEQHKIALKNRTKEILEDIATLKNKGTLHSITADATFFVKKLHTAVDNLYPDAEKSLKKKIAFDIKFRNELIAWARKQGIAGQVNDDFYRMVARQMVYRLLARIIFYETLTGKFKHLPKLELNGLSGQQAVDKLKELFSKAADTDWLAVFESDLADKVEFSVNSIELIHKLVDELNYYNFSILPHDVIGAVFEKLIPPEERHTLGQYFTRENLVDLILAFCVRTPDAVVLDPTCGTGTFLIRAYDKKKVGGLHDHKELLGQLWGVDIAHFPAELATINLFRQDVSDPTNFPRILCKDFFDIRVGQTHKFPPLKASPDPNFQSIDEKMPVFNAAVGNFPFIRQELINKVDQNYKAKLEKVIKEEWLAEYPDAFNFPEQDKKFIIESYKSGKKVVHNNAELNLSGQADIYAYLFFHTARFIKEGGRMGFITSNSWLDVAYGYELQKFILNNFKLIAILESRCEPWFEDAAVNTVVTVLERCSNKAERDNHIVKFVKIKKKLADLIPQDMKLEAQKRWYHLDYLVDFVDNAGNEHIETSKGVVENNLKGLETKEDSNFRIRIKRQGELLDELNQEGKTAKWGKYLRAPDVYFKILTNSAKTSKLDVLANVNRGVTTNNVDFFYLSKDSIEHWGIEKKYIVSPVIYSPKEVPNITVDESNLVYSLFLCNQPRISLKGTKVLKYIESAEKKGINKSATFKGSAQWYGLGEIIQKPCSLFYARQGESFRVIYNPKGIIPNDNLYTIVPKEGNDNFLLCAVLNSTLFALGLEVNGRINLGEGALKVQAYELAECVAPDIGTFEDKEKDNIIDAFNKLSARPVKSIFEEVKMKDRLQLDKLVLEALGLDPKKYLKPLYAGLTELVRERIELGKMRTKVKKAKIAKDVEALKSEVLQSVLPNGAKKFPEDFLEKHLKPEDCMTVSVPGEPLSLGAQFLTQQEVIAVTGPFKYMAGSVNTAKYIVYAQKPNVYLIAVPKDDEVTGKAVQAYGIYLKSLKEKLAVELANLVDDYKLVGTIVAQIFTDLGLPEIPS